MNYTYKGFEVTVSARQLNLAPNEVWGPLYRINGQDQSTAWTPRDRNVIFATEQNAVNEAKERAQWIIDNTSE